MPTKLVFSAPRDDTARASCGNGAKANSYHFFSDGRVEFYNIENLSLGPFITTAHCLLISEDLPPGPLTARPPCCGQLISIPVTIADCIKHWAMEGGEGGYTDPALLMDCPSCGTPLRMNPFFVNL